MPADTTLAQEPGALHGNASAPYPCHAWPRPPSDPAWAIDYGYCRTSLDHQPPHYKQGSSDPRCPRDCPFKAPQHVAQVFVKHFAWHGAKAAAKNAKAHFDKRKAWQPHG